MVHRLGLGLALLACSCATTVSRLDGEVVTPLGGARNECEQRDWLVMAPTRAEYVRPGKKRSVARDDGVGLYRVGSREPEAIPERTDLFEDSALVRAHEVGVRRHDRDRAIAIGLGAASAVAFVVGSVLFVNAFETTTERKADGTKDEVHSVDTGLAAAGGATVALGFGLGIGGLWMAPSAKERAEADAWRYVFLPERDDLEDVQRRVMGHNSALRKRCNAAP